MSQPREVIAGATYLLTRRVLRRHLLFRPDAAITKLLIYTLAVSARRYGIHVHALCAMSTHVHIVLTDNECTLPRFLQFFHRLVALGTKVLRAWEGPVWDHEATSVVRLETPEAVVEKIAYVLANPVAAGLVKSACEWPGAKVLVSDLGRGVLRATRPEVYFDPMNPEWPEESSLSLMLPPGVEKYDAEGCRFRRAVTAELARQEVAARAEIHRQGYRFLGAERASKISPYQRATSFEALRSRNPTFAVGRANRDAWRSAARTVGAFRAAYRDALSKWRTGLRDVIFPSGTWWMRVFHGVTVANFAPAE